MRKFRIPYIPYRSLLLSTTVLNDNCNFLCTLGCTPIGFLAFCGPVFDKSNNYNYKPSNKIAVKSDVKTGRM